MAEQLGLDAYAVFGLSGGGPFAVATAVADPGHVRALGIIGGTGPWRLLDGPSKGPDGYACLAMADAGDLAGAWDCMRRDVKRAYGRMVELDDAARVDRMLTDISDGSHLLDDEHYRSLWADNIRVVLQNVDGSTFDNLAWGVDWDVEPRDVAALTRCCMASATRRVHAPRPLVRRPDRGCRPRHPPGRGHVDVIDGHWPEVLTRLRPVDASGASVQPDMTGPRRPKRRGPVAGRAAHQLIGGSASRPSQSRAADRPVPPGRETSCSPLRAGRLDREDRRQEAEDQQHGEGDHRPESDGGESDLAHRCVHVRETPTPGILFRPFSSI